jgi:hypothetical protein
MHRSAVIPTVSSTLLAVLVLAGCPEKEDYRQPEAEKALATGTTPRADQPPPPPPKKGPPADLGTCTIKVTGGMTAEQVTPGGKNTTNVSYWYSPEERKNMMGVDGYVVNCNGDKFRFSILPGGGKEDGMPFGPKKFTFSKGKSDGANVMMAFGQATLADPSGTIDITALDKTHIAGTVELSGKVVPGNKPIKVSGSFNLICPGLSACEF